MDIDMVTTGLVLLCNPSWFINKDLKQSDRNESENICSALNSSKITVFYFGYYSLTFEKKSLKLYREELGVRYTTSTIH